VHYGYSGEKLRQRDWEFLPKSEQVRLQMPRRTIIVAADEVAVAREKLAHEVERLQAAGKQVAIVQCPPGFIEEPVTLPVYLLGVPDHVDPNSLRLDGRWRMSARCLRAFRVVNERAAQGRRDAETRSDEELRTAISADNEGIVNFLEKMGTAGSRVDLPDPARLSRDEMLRMIEEEFAGPEPDLELIYPGADDPTVLTIADALILPETELRERATNIVADLMDQYGAGGLGDDFPKEVDKISRDELLGLIKKWAFLFDPAANHPPPESGPAPK
jgi:hypothetical protein